MEIRKILDILEAGVRFKKPVRALDEEPVAAFGKTYTPPDSAAAPAPEPAGKPVVGTGMVAGSETQGGQVRYGSGAAAQPAATAKPAAATSSAPPAGGTPFTNPAPDVAAKSQPAAAAAAPAAAAPQQNTAAPASAGGYAQSAQPAAAAAAPAAAPAAARPQQNTAAPASAGGYAQSAQPAAAAPAAARPDVEAQKKGMFATAAVQPVNNQSSGMTAQSQAQNTRATSAQATAPTSSGYTAQSQAQKTSPAVPTASPGAAAAMASKSAPTTAPAQTSDQIATAALNAPDQGTSGASLGIQGGFGKMAEEELEEELKEFEELAEMMRLSGLLLNEKAVSKQQQKFMGMVHAMQKDQKVKGASPELKKVAKTMSKKDAEDFAQTKHKGLPKKVTEGIMLDEGGNALNHIVNRFKYEVKNFMNTGDMADNLYDALYDYYLDTGELPYGIAKAREGDPRQWVEERFYQDMGSEMSESVPVREVASDDTLQRLAELAGLNENDVKLGPKSPNIDAMTKDEVNAALKNRPRDPADDMSDDEVNVALKNRPRDPADDMSDDEVNAALNECGDMDMDQEDSMNVSTNMSSNGTRSVNISAQGGKADELLQMLKMAGMRPHDDHDHSSMREPEVIIIGSDDEMMEQELEEARKKRTTRYVNTPDEEYQTVASITRQGNDLNREKKQFAGKPRLGDNPMAESALDVDLDAMLESILIREQDSKIEYDEVEQRVKANFPAAKRRDPASQEIPMEPESPASRVTGPRSMKVPGERTGTENYRDDDKEIHEEEKPTWLQRQPSKSQEEIAKDWEARGQASKDYVIPAERPYKDEKSGRTITPPRGATNPPQDPVYPSPKGRGSR